MALTKPEFEAILSNSTKTIVGDITWSEDEDHSPSVEFRAEVESDVGWPLFIKGSYNRLIGALTFAVISKTEGRIYALDLGKDHRNPDTGQLIGEKHKHAWTEEYRDKVAYVPPDITEPATNPRAVWTQFCQEAKIRHRGQLQPVPALQSELF
ncbi:MAG: hypothetical protein ABSB42_07730 [Tepidisphaeraceae bacterium]|jgi:uncharacterized protein DUF6978